MKSLFILVEGDTEEQFVKLLLSPYLSEKEIYEITPIKIQTKVGFKGGFVKYDHLKRDANQFLKQRQNVIVSTLVDYFRLPVDVPGHEKCQQIHNIDNRIGCLENGMRDDVGSDRFIPYIQKFEFEALLFSSNQGFERYYGGREARLTAAIVESHPNPEEINSNPTTSPSNRLKEIIPQYDKVSVGNIIALDIGMEKIVEKCPRFRNWIETLIDAVSR